jgi:hypothetical protein
LKDFSTDRNSAEISNRKSKFFAPLAQLAEQVTLNHGIFEGKLAMLPKSLPIFPSAENLTSSQMSNRSAQGAREILLPILRR